MWSCNTFLHTRLFTTLGSCHPLYLPSCNMKFYHTFYQGEGSAPSYLPGFRLTTSRGGGATNQLPIIKGYNFSIPNTPYIGSIGFIPHGLY